jgi:hypothetical protein
MCRRHSRAGSGSGGCWPRRLIQGGRCRIALSARSFTRVVMAAAASLMYAPSGAAASSADTVWRGPGTHGSSASEADCGSGDLSAGAIPGSGAVCAATCRLTRHAMTWLTLRAVRSSRLVAVRVSASAGSKSAVSARRRAAMSAGQATSTRARFATESPRIAAASVVRRSPASAALSYAGTGPWPGSAGRAAARGGGGLPARNASMRSAMTLAALSADASSRWAATVASSRAGSQPSPSASNSRRVTAPHAVSAASVRPPSSPSAATAARR